MAFNAFTSTPSAPPPPINPPPGLVGPGQFESQSELMMNGQQAIQQQQQAMEQMQQLQHQFQQQMQQMQQMMHPAMNDQPLEFNVNKNKPPMAIVNEDSNPGNSQRIDDGDRRDPRVRESRIGSGRDRDRRDRRDRDRDRDRERNEDRKKRENKTEKETTPTGSQPVPAPPLPSGMPMMGMNAMLGGMMGGMMPGMMSMMPGMDPTATMMSMGQYGMMPGMVPDGTAMMPPDGAMSAVIGGEAPSMFPGQRPVLEFKECTLVPPSPHAPPPVTRERPLGCRTVYVGGLPDNCNEEIIRDVFGRCGEMITVRLSKKNFCHIRFAHENSVDAAMLYSGYRMRIGNNTDAPNTGRLHVDYAQARIDQYEYECRQRALQREARHRERMERDRLRPASPPPIPHYTDHEAASIVDLIKTDDGFKKAVQTVVAWLERGDLNKRNANTFYSMIQSTHSHVRRLLNEKMQFEEELQAAKDLHRQRLQNVVVQFGYIEKIFTCAAHKKCWDHFTKAQRKNIESWKKQSVEIKQLQLADGLNEEAEEEMDVSDTDDMDGPQKKRPRTADVNALKDENDSLKCQLEAYKNEVDLVKAELKADMQGKERQIKVLQQTVQKMTMELSANKEKLRNEESLVKKLKAKVKVLDDKDGFDLADLEENSLKDEEPSQPDISSSTPGLNTDHDAKLVGLISTFLHVHPFGASVDYIWSFLTKLDPSLRPSEVEALMSRFPGVFRQELSGIGAGMERRWVFCGFETPI